MKILIKLVMLLVLFGCNDNITNSTYTTDTDNNQLLRSSSSIVSVYDVGDVVSEQHQNITKSTCYAGNDYDVGNLWSLGEWNGATNGGHYNVIFIEMSATW
jgi:hypothetical protein